MSRPDGTTPQTAPPADGSASQTAPPSEVSAPQTEPPPDGAAPQTAPPSDVSAPPAPTGADREDPVGPAPKGRRRWRVTLPAATPALLAYVAVRVIGLVILWAYASAADTDWTEYVANSFDAGWYQQIAERGYDPAIPQRPDGSLRPSNLAFFPLYPGLIVLVTELTSVSPAVAGLAVAWVFAVAAAWGIYAIGAHLHSRTMGVLLAALWGVVPHAVVQTMAYSEPVLTALVAWSLYALLRRRWLVAGALCLVAGLARPTASALIAAVGLAALVAIVRRRDSWRPWAAAALAPLGYLGYLWWVGDRMGRLDGYFYVQRESWTITFDGGGHTVESLGMVLTEPMSLQWYVVTLLLAVAALLVVVSLMNRYPLPVLVYSVVSFVLVIGAAGAYYGKGRYLMPVFTLLIPVATALARARRSTQVAVVVFLAVVSGWYGSYLALVWTASP